jgi:hypothetical protein
MRSTGSSGDVFTEGRLRILADAVEVRQQEFMRFRLFPAPLKLYWAMEEAIESWRNFCAVAGQSPGQYPITLCEGP